VTNILFKIRTGLGMGDVVCASGALKKLTEELNCNVFVETGQPTLFEDQPHVIKAFRGLYDYYDIDAENFYQAFDKIYVADYYNENHLKSKTNIVEAYCESVGVEKRSLPYIFVNYEKYNNFNFINEDYIFVALTDRLKPITAPDIGLSKHLSHNYSQELIHNLKVNFPKYRIVDIHDLNPEVSDKKELLYIAMKAKTFVAVDGGMIHFASNEPTFTKGVCLYRNQNAVSSYGYKEQVNLISDTPLIGPYVEIAKIINELKIILGEKDIH
jgi:hypothetical protein